LTKTGAELLKIEQAPQTLRDIVQERMRAAIIQGHFEPGQRLVERTLCDELGVSRTVVRETIRYLEAEGLVELIPHKGPVVATLTWDKTKQIYDIRLLLESEAAAACATNQSEPFSALLSAALENLRAATHAPNRDGILQATTRFYELIFQEAGHTVALEIVQRLNGRISRLRFLTLAAKDRDQPGIAHMQAIHDAIIAGDAEGAKKAVQRHIADASRTAESHLTTTEQDS
jgi:DNA-binding GntR family transcriptional regulator